MAQLRLPINGTWYNLQTNTLYDEQGYPKVAEQPVIINPITITPSMAYGGAGTWDEVVAWSGGTAGASYVVVAGKFIPASSGKAD